MATTETDLEPLRTFVSAAVWLVGIFILGGVLRYAVKEYFAQQRRDSRHSHDEE